MSYLDKQLAEMEALLPQHLTQNTAVSKSSIGWHILHNLKVINSVYTATAASAPSQYRWKFNFARLVVLLTGKIPRGKAKAPKRVQPADDFTDTDLIAELEKAKQSAASFDQLDAKLFFPHHIFGMLRLPKTKRFLAIHTDHHLHIMRDMLKAKA
jgi:hypothetical protein